MEAAPKVSIVMPSYNRAELLPRAIGSILMQTFTDFELIVVDDASSDETAEVVSRFDDRRIRYICHESNKGGPAARNTGIEASRGDYIAFQDSDDEWLIDKLSRQVAKMDSSPADVGVVYCGILRWDGCCASYFPPAKIEQREGDILPRLLRRSFIFTQTLLIRRNLLVESGNRFDEQLPRFQEWDLVIRLAQVTKFGLIDEPLVIAYETPDSLTRNKSAAVKARMIILEKYERLLRDYPIALSEHFCDLGHLKCLYQSSSEGKYWFAKAVRTNPKHYRAWAGLLFAFLGKGAYLRCLRAMGRNVSD